MCIFIALSLTVLTHQEIRDLHRGVVARTQQDDASTQDTCLAVDDSYYCIPTGHSEPEEAMSLKLSFTHLFT